ncbi:hypothetical protein PTTG_12087 [Puccinia triticina 1-1 BBBD Race 1]|uniref:hAT-like transposase RNase-H fold domain-containing protein n=1 Tax=Puccinia triticina (isolate 1-1 / race 1 (BBBD)) TaxID=630390 RepID=A0A180GRH4_PUCT1|nr:hypothetical protein PTTG_12087 [Puccinia triticina 1-1 BBBD Race 1]
MATEADRLIRKKTGVKLNLKGNHIRCFCHKVALILNAGLHAIELSSKGLISSKAETLGFVPGLAPIVEESEEKEPEDSFVVEDVVLAKDNEEVVNDGNLETNLPSRADSPSKANSLSITDLPSGADSPSGAESPDEPDTWDPPEENKNKVDFILKKVDFVIQRITSSAAKRCEYATWCKKLDFDGPSLIAGYGIRWNIKFQSRDHGYQARKIIGKLIENEKDRQEQEGGKNYYDNVDILRGEWELVKNLNETLSEFYYITKKMEGDNSSGSLMISEYQNIKDFISEKIESISEPEFQIMLEKMLVKTDAYLDEALNCDAIVIATALNPSFRLSIFQMWFPGRYAYTLDLLKDLYDAKKAEVNAAKTLKEPHQLLNPPKASNQRSKHTDFFPETTKAPLADELNSYIEGKHKLPTCEAANCLDWWKLSRN